MGGCLLPESRLFQAGGGSGTAVPVLRSIRQHQQRGGFSQQPSQNHGPMMTFDKINALSTSVGQLSIVIKPRILHHMIVYLPLQVD